MCYAKAPGVDAAYAARLFNYGKHQASLYLSYCLVEIGKLLSLFLG